MEQEQVRKAAMLLTDKKTKWYKFGTSYAPAAIFQGYGYYYVGQGLYVVFHKPTQAFRFIQAKGPKDVVDKLVSLLLQK